MQPFLVAANADGGLEEIAQGGFSQQLFTRAVANDAAVAHENDALDLGKNVAEMMGDEHQAGALPREAAEGVAEFTLRGQVERIGRLIQ